jgi:hypothetical protein
MIPISLVVEDPLSEQVLRKILVYADKGFCVGACYGNKGREHIRKSILKYNNASEFSLWFVLTDLDDVACASTLIAEWFSKTPKNKKLIFRVAVKEVEAWVMADREKLAEFLGVRMNLIPNNVEQIDDPKKFIINLTKKSRKMAIRDAIVPPEESFSKVGPDYNGQMGFFVREYWRPSVAQNYSRSLKKTIDRLKEFNG